MTHKFQRKARNLLVVLQYRFRENVAKIGIFATNSLKVSHGGRSAVGEGKVDKKRESLTALSHNVGSTVGRDKEGSKKEQ